MTTPNANVPDLLCEQVLEDARRQSEEILRRARQEAAALLEKAAAEAEQTRQARLELARAEAARRTEAILATVSVEVGRLRSARVEALLQTIYEQARRRLEARRGLATRESVIALAAEALQRMAGEAFVIKLSATDRRAFGDGLAAELQRRVGRSPLRLTVVEDPAVTDGGVVVEDVESRQVWDNRLRARLDRLWPELRQQIAAHADLASVFHPQNEMPTDRSRRRKEADVSPIAAVPPPYVGGYETGGGA
ncbi:MAG: hypothetical protein FJ388_02215 [Verrucomicrobia bacterium]|nr:hypothetical protein [Verrucomicrobiota bacterium]